MGLLNFFKRGPRFHREQRKYLEEHFSSIHRHLDFLHDDLFALLKNYMQLNDDKSLELITDHPVACESNDHLHPVGTLYDNTRCPKFFWKCEGLFPDKTKLRFLDLGCSSGGLVLDALLRGHFAIGLEGSDSSIKEQRAAWRIIPNNLFTCDITQEFMLRNHQSGERQTFDVISMWDVLEHIAEQDIPQMLSNIRVHLDKEGIFVASISTATSFVDGVDLHVTKKPKEWWEGMFSANGFEIMTPLEPQFMPRGGYNPPHCFLAPRKLKNNNFGIMVKKRESVL